MPNSNTPFGLRPVRNRAGGVVRFNPYRIASGAASMFYGDPIKTDTVNRNKCVVPAGPGDRWLGAFAGCEYVDVQGNQQFSRSWISGTAILSGSVVTCYVYDEPDTLFEIQSNGTFAAADIGKDFDLVAGSGNAQTGNSTFAMDQTTGSTVTGKQLKVIDVSGAAGNTLGAYARVLVLNAKPELGAAITPV